MHPGSSDALQWSVPCSTRISSLYPASCATRPRAVSYVPLAACAYCFALAMMRRPSGFGFAGRVGLVGRSGSGLGAGSLGVV